VPEVGFPGVDADLGEFACAQEAGWQCWPAFDPRPELAQPLQPGLDFVPGDDGSVDGADRSANNPIRFDTGFVERLVDALICGLAPPPCMTILLLPAAEKITASSKGSATTRFG
jgi:hypothetical protein